MKVFDKPWQVPAMTVACFIVLALAVFGWVEWNKWRNDVGISSAHPAAPPPIKVVECKALPEGMRRIGAKSGIQFDVPLRDFAVSSGCTDAPPLSCGSTITSSNDPAARLFIEYPFAFSAVGIDPISTFSEHKEQRDIHDAEWSVVGRENWGYLNSGERWRQVRLTPGRIAVQYGFTKRESAERFDRIIGSACFSE